MGDKGERGEVRWVADDTVDLTPRTPNVRPWRSAKEIIYCVFNIRCC